MRTTLDIDADVFLAVKELATRQKSTAGRVLSDLARAAMQPKGPTLKIRNGVPILSSGRVVTTDMVRQIESELDHLPS